VLLAHGVDLNAKSDTWSQLMAVDPYSYPPYNMMVLHGGETALMFAARIGDLDSAKLLVAAGAKPSDEDAWGVSATTLAEHSGFSDVARFLLDKGANPNASKAGFTALHVAIMWRDEKTITTLLEHGADPNIPLKTWTPNRRSGDLDRNFEPELVGASPFWLAARFLQPGVMDLLAKHGADTKFIHRSEKVTEARSGVVTAGGKVEALVHRTDATTALMAAVGMGSGTPWVQAERADKEKLTLEAVKIAVDAGVDVNATAPDGRTALDGAKSLRFDSVTNYLVSKGAITGAAKKAGK
jgi:ankyrin repeat protein